MKLSERELLILNRLIEVIETENISNEFLIQLIELGGSYLNLKTISNYAKQNKLSYNGVKNNRIIEEIFKVKFVIDNE